MRRPHITSWSLGLFLYMPTHLSPLQVTPSSTPKDSLILRVDVNQVPILLHLFSKHMQGGNFIYKKKKRQSKYNGKNMYIIVEKQSSIKSKKQKHSPPYPRNI